MVGDAEQEMATQIAYYEIMLVNDVITPLAAMLEVSSRERVSFIWDSICGEGICLLHVEL